MTLTAPARPSPAGHPALSPAAEAVVRATAGVVAEHSETISARFYESMLGERPQLWRLFNRANQETGEQSRALAASVVAYAVQLIDPDAPSFEPVLRRIAGKHITLGITPEQYTLVGRHLLGAVGTVLGAAVTPAIAAAWDEVYWLFATQLIATEARLYAAADIDAHDPLRPYRVMRRTQESPGTVSLVLEPADGAPLPALEAGQYVTVFVDLADGARQPRQYSVSSIASDTRLQITVAQVRNGPPGQVSTHLQEAVTVGDILEVSSPAGDFGVPPGNGPLLIATAGAGITTVLPLVEHLARTQPGRTLILAHADRSRADHALLEAISIAAEALDDVVDHAWYETVDADDSTSFTGLMDFDRIEFTADTHVLSCGPLPFLRAVRLAALQRGVPPESISYEVFGPDLWSPVTVTG
ncbi:globin domain-containing protein [Rhodococcoides yunnanense]|uniref:nitric oxide dioxygenase n=1 Tax=Rhodococcoides yunnanense TaxID=278209 RepID=A0ABU4BIZ6_9NOCA|nr:globin domain-containing protein [Rhodococcus yunnanensis]MDV6264201.1 globin domain-containing protein [Rhodococcus yunnanensis]